MMARHDRGFTMVELLVVIIVVGLGLALTLPALLRGQRNDRLAKCEARLRALWEAEAAYRARAGNVPTARGSAYWAEILGPGADPEAPVCPLSGHDRYRGPAGDPSRLPPFAPIGGDRPGSHGAGEGGFLLLRNGEVRACLEGNADWIAAVKTLAP
ncbi:MAG TPA: prepilin-type N-terminal cleavage/methylation domain-containing protein [Planctomycetota bacterium]|nr:prepilin-type N-terminal cleavage/methylation domain-containing protein [Planctomycetota bacterium]